MSLGYKGQCTLVAEDDNFAIYIYQGECWNLPKELRNKIEVIEGEFSIEKRCFEEPEIHTRIHRFPNGKKKTETKKIIHTVDWGKYLKNGGIVIDKLCGVDTYLIKEGHRPRHILNCLLSHLFREYQKQVKSRRKQLSSNSGKEVTSLLLTRLLPQLLDSLYKYTCYKSVHSVAHHFTASSNCSIHVYL